jgi:hypothetical protein
MKTIILNNSNYNVPTSWEDITVGQQVQVEKLNADNPDLQALNVIAGYCDIDIETVKKLNVNEAKAILNEFVFISSELPSTPVSTFVHNGNEYQVVETLLKAEFQDFISLETLLQQYKGKEYQALPKIVAILAKRRGESLTDFVLEERAKEMETLPLPIANRIYLFFCAVATTHTPLQTHDLHEIDNRIKSLVNSIETTAKKRVGLGFFFRFAMAILLKKTRYYAKGWNLFFSGFNCKNEKASLNKTSTKY